MSKSVTVCIMLSLLFLVAAPSTAADQIPAGAKVYIAPMNGFETYFKAALEEKRVPLTVVEDRAQADYEISGAAESEKAGAAKKVLLLDWHSKEQASIRVINLKSSAVVFAYSVHKASSAHGKRSSAEACAKHLNDDIARK
jgi:hypothetical protein